MTPATQELTHCPTCGVKLTEKQRGMSLCLFCASPLTAAKVEGETTRNMERLAKMKDHADFAEAMALSPPEEPELAAARELRRRAVLLCVFGVALVALGAWLGEATLGGALLHPLGLLGALLFLWGLWKLIQGLRGGTGYEKLPVLKRPAIVTDRRSETAMATWSGNTDYYFTLEFEDGASGEFRYPGRGTRDDPLVTGRTGVAHTRGPNLLHFYIIKV